MMDQTYQLIVLLVALLALLGGGIWVGLSLMGVAYIAMALFSPRPIGEAMAINVWTASSGWTLTALPLFVWMGEILFRTKLSENLFKGLNPWMRPLPGRLLHVNILGCALFAAISGSSAATTATVGRMALPEMRRRGYPEKMMIGTLAGGGTLGLLIPPSIILIVYGVAAEVSIAKLFMAGILPGIVLASLFMGYIVVWSLLHPDQIPADDEAPGWGQKFRALGELLPVVGLIAFVLGSIYTGIATATEAAAFGVIGSFAVAAIGRDLSWANFSASLMGAVRTSCMISLILAGSAFLTLAMGFTGIPRALADLIASLNLSPLQLIVALALFYIVLGCFLDGISAVVLTMAVVMPMITQAGIDLIWFGVFIVIVVETAQITPPVGFNLFVLQGMTGRSITYVARVAAPMFAVMVVMLILITLVPEIVTLLPGGMVRGAG
ncbi:TRAP transporter large permease subunit [Tistrella mobilis]